MSLEESKMRSTAELHEVPANLFRIRDWKNK